MAQTKVAQMPTPTPTSAPDIMKKSVVIRLRLGRLGNNRKVSGSQVEVDADKNLLHISKRLIDTSAFAKITELDGKIKRYVDNECLPFPENGFALIPRDMLEQVENRLREWKKLREEAVNEFCAAYPKMVEEAAKGLRALYSPMDYPSVEDVRAKFTFSWKYVSFAVPDILKEINRSIFEDERKKSASMLHEAAHEVEQLMRATALELIEALRDKLSDERDGKPKQLKELHVQKFKDFLFTYNLKNVTDDKDLAPLIEKARGLLEGTSLEALRTTDSLRDKVRKGLDEIKGSLSKLVEEKPTRKFRVEEE